MDISWDEWCELWCIRPDEGYSFMFPMQADEYICRQFDEAL